MKRDGRLWRPIRRATYFFLGLALCGASIVIATQAAELDVFGPPPDNDVSAQTGPFIGLQFADNALQGVAPANEGAIILEGDVQGTKDDVSANNVVQEPGIERGGGDYNIPTNSRPSPSFGAQPFTQQMLLFEEFGPVVLDPGAPFPT